MYSAQAEFLEVCGSGDVERVRQLLGGVDVNQHQVVYFYCRACVLNLLQTPLHRACSGGHVEVVILLLSAGAQVDVQDEVSCGFDCVDLSSSVWMDSPPSCLL
jgi:hypothetical protein